MRSTRLRPHATVRETFDRLGGEIVREYEEMAAELAKKSELIERLEEEGKRLALLESGVRQILAVAVWGKTPAAQRLVEIEQIAAPLIEKAP